MDYSANAKQSSDTTFEPDFSTQDNFLEEIRNIAKQEQQKSEILEDNPFPVEAFPKPIQDIIWATNKSLRFPTDFMGTAMLTASATAIGNSHTASVMPGWEESAIIYAALVAPPGSNKSHPLSFAFEPLSKLDSKAYHQYSIERKEYDQIQNLGKKQREQAQLSEDYQEPVLKKILLSDFTQEALVKAHHNNPRGICAINDELAGFVKNLNRYNSGSDTENWLSTWNGKPVNVDRSSKASIRINRPYISVIGTIQNGVLFQLAKDGKANNGFIDRFLFAFPLKIQKEVWSEVTLDPIYPQNWEKYLLNLLDLKLEISEWGIPVSKSLSFSVKAKERIKAWQEENTALCNNAPTEAIQGMYTKLENYTIRFALILQLLTWACCEGEKTEIKLKAVEGAIKLIEYFRKTANTVQRIISKEDPLDRLDRQKRQVYEKLPHCFATSEGLLIAEKVSMSESSFKRFIRDKSLFDRLGQGRYEKQF